MTSGKIAKEKFELEGAPVLPLGTGSRGKDLVISLPTAEKITEIVLYDKKTGAEAGRVSVDETYKKANVYSFKVNGAAGYDYSLMSGEKYVRDTYAKVVVRENVYGVYSEKYDWSGEVRPDHNYEDSFIYRLHVRGFTKHNSSKVKAKGTYSGIVEKISYLKELGVTAVELMPAYEFDENIANTGIKNYWGYGNAYYFAPKCSYSSRGNQVKEFKDMVKALHKAGIEVIMDFYFVPGTNPFLMVDALRHWVLEYHIDGIHVNTEVVPTAMLKEDPVLTLVKIFADNWDMVSQFRERGDLTSKHIAIFNDDFLINVRRFIKSDEGQVGGIMDKLKRNPDGCGIINYLANHYTFTLMDTVSYNMKHNEENGENNQDGTDYNYSWNCGIEGETRRKKVNELRVKQIKNALTLLFMSQGTPMIYAGDEMGKSQKGNNNPYCQDNTLSWMNWNLLKTNREIFDFVKTLSLFRKNHRILHMKEQPKGMDYLAKGMPDVSFHGVEPWRVDNSYGNRQLAVLYNGRYADSECLYAAYNMYWEEVVFSVPQPTPGKQWVCSFSTDGESSAEELLNARSIRVPARSVVVLAEEKIG